MAHEDLTREHHAGTSSDRSFGLVFAAAFAVLAVWPMVHSQRPRPWAFAVALAFAIVALVKPGLLHALNRAWARLGTLMGRVVSPLALGLLFYAVLAPLAFVMRLSGKDPLRLKPDAAAASYWIRREPPGPRPDSMDHQF